MNEKKWTPSQQAAIDSDGGNLLLSAAAGSGKTAVLVERITKRMTDPFAPTDADRFLIVTFSHAAADEMKERISARIAALLEEQPDNYALVRQQMLLSKAQISTIHSFCMYMIKSSFQTLSLPADFKLGDEKELQLIREDVAKGLMEQCYQEGKQEFLDLVELLSSGRDDKKVVETILRMYDFLRSHPFYLEWLDEKYHMYTGEIPLVNTPWGETILSYTLQTVAYGLTLTEKSIEIAAQDDKMAEKYLSSLLDDKNQLLALQSKVEQGDWNQVKDAVRQFHFTKLSPLRGLDEKKALVKDNRDMVKDMLAKLEAKQFCTTEKEFLEDLKDLQPKIQVLFHLVKEFDKEFYRKKQERHLVDFSDLEHFALELLIQRQGTEYVKTPFADEISARFDYVLVDEYQDTNQVQDMIFQAVSKGNNLFMVGDVKQSIYRFRQAMPEIFLHKKSTYFPFDGVRYPAKIILGHNFRSRKEVTDSINFLFRCVMSEQVGEISYNAEEELVPAAAYPESSDRETQLHLISEKEGEAAAVTEANHVAREIRNLLDSGYLVADKDQMRPIRPSDICILLRSPKRKGEIYLKALSAHDLSGWSDVEKGYLTSVEVSSVLSLLQAIDNPMLDISLAAAMMSPIFGFTPDEMAVLRSENKKLPLYRCCMQKAEEGQQRYGGFLQTLADMRVWAATLPVSQLIRRIFNTTGVMPMVRGMKNGVIRQANLRLLVEYAASYEKGKDKTLGGFVGFVTRLRERGDDFEGARLVSSQESIRIMSIHRSKGLEYPVVFLCDTAKRFNAEDLRADTLLHSKMGFACVRRDRKLRCKFTTVPMEALKLEMERSLLSEEMRILYVALTRAKEKLILTGTYKDLGKKLTSLCSSLTPEKTVPPYLVQKNGSYLDWILLSLLHHPQGIELCRSYGIEQQEIIPTHSPFAIQVYQEEEGTQVDKGEELSFTAQPDEQLLAELIRKTSNSYPYSEETQLPSKLSVTAIIKQESGEDYTFTAKPRFMQKSRLTGADRGTAVHNFMLFADHSKAEADLSGELDRLVKQQFLTKAQADAISHRELKSYYSSTLYQRIKASNDVKKEFRFMTDMGKEHLKDILPGIGENKITVQGIADVVFAEQDELVLVDYKTDHVKDMEVLKERYANQLKLYGDILTQLTGKRVKERILYSLSLGRWMAV